MSNVNDKYGFDGSSEEVKKFHSQRRMFVIVDGVLKLGAKGDTDSHADWFMKEGWISDGDDSFMDGAIRGYIDDSGIYFYRGYDFRIGDGDIASVKKILNEIVRLLGIPLGLHVYGGKMKSKSPGTWPPMEDYGPVDSLF